MDTTGEATETRVTIIRPRQGWASLGLGELLEYRELLGVFIWRDVAVRYKQTVLGVAWAVIQPVTAMVIFTIFFGRVAGLQKEIEGMGVPYSLFAFAALVPWTYFSHALALSSASIVDNRHILTKVYFPRILLPVAPLLSALVDFGISMAVLVAMMLWMGLIPTAAVLYLPVLVLLMMVTALSVGLWLSGLNALYRDFRYVVPFLLQIWLFATPVVYPSSMIDERWRTLYGLNPMAGVIEGFRWALFGRGDPPGAMLWVSVGVVMVVLLLGLEFFRRVERTFVDVV